MIDLDAIEARAQIETGWANDPSLVANQDRRALLAYVRELTEQLEERAQDCRDLVAEQDALRDLLREWRATYSDFGAPSELERRTDAILERLP